MDASLQFFPNAGCPRMSCLRGCEDPTKSLPFPPATFRRMTNAWQEKCVSKAFKESALTKVDDQGSHPSPFRSFRILLGFSFFHKAPVAKRLAEGHLPHLQGEAVCLDRCVAKYLDVHEKLG